MTASTPQKSRARADLTSVFCDAPSIVNSAMTGDGRWPVKLSTGHVVIFTLEGDYLVARVTPEQAKILKELSLFEVDGFDRKVDPAAPIENFMTEGERRGRELEGKNAPAGNGPLELLKGLGLEHLLADRITAAVAEQVAIESRARAEARAAEDEARRAELSGEFGFVRLAEELTDDQAIELMNTYMPERDPTAIKAAARITMISKAAPHDRALQGAIRDLLGPLGE